MRKKVFLSIAGVLVLGVLLLLFNQSIMLDYKDFLNELLSEDESVTKITIRTRSDIQRK